MSAVAGADGYGAARERAAFVDRSHRFRFEFTGARAAETLNGILTNDIAKLEPHAGLYAAALTPKGKVIADVRVFALPGRFVVDTPAAAGPGFGAMLRKYVNPRLAAWRDVTDEMGAAGLYGPQAHLPMAATLGVEPHLLAGLTSFGSVASPGGSWFVARVPDHGVPGFDLFAPRGDPILNRLRLLQLPQLDADATDALRVEAGWPLYGVDMDDSILAQEAGLDAPYLNAISFDKGCYTGQETVARVHFRGHVNRTLRGLRGDRQLTMGATLHAPDGLPVGDVRTAVSSPRFGPIALAYVRREVGDGATLTARAGSDERQATVVALPFG
jgi:folate-binding protein YgfZ